MRLADFGNVALKSLANVPNEGKDSKIKTTEAMGPKSKHKTCTDPKIKKRYGTDPEIKQNEGLDPKIKKNEGTYPTIQKTKVWILNSTKMTLQIRKSPK